MKINKAAIKIQRWIRKIIRRQRYFELVAKKKEILHA
jgi:hypothetical protein